MMEKNDCVQVNANLETQIKNEDIKIINVEQTSLSKHYDYGEFNPF